MKLVTLKTFDNGFEAHLLKSKLESEGIESYIFDEHSVTLNPLYNVTLGGIKVKIKEDDLNKSLEILHVINETKITNEENELVECPNCKSTDIYSGFKSMKGLKGTFSAIFAFLLFVFPLYYNVSYRCKSCGFDFKTKD